MMMNILLNTMKNFSKLSRPKPKLNKLKQQKKSRAIGDDKAAKLSKSQQEMQNKAKAVEQQKIIQETERKQILYKVHDPSLEQYISPKDLDLVFKKQKLYLTSKTGALLDTNKSLKNFRIPIPKQNYQYLPNGRDPTNTVDVQFPIKKPPYGNYIKPNNKKIKGQVKMLQPTEFDQKTRRVGTIGKKLGMTILYDHWGHMVPVTVVLLDRVQVVQIKKANQQGFSQVQMGAGDFNLKKITKPLLGHFMKAGVPPKRHLHQFKVSNNCLLPVGYMMSVRHYTPGMKVDVIGKTVGHGFSGTIKKYGFRRQPETHGNSLTTRVLGSTGGRQDPGRVFKQKKMYGRMGGNIDVQKCMKVFKIDVDRNLLYIKGTLPGKAGTILKIRDTVVPVHRDQNLTYASFPTFIQEEGKSYARQLSMYCGERDPGQIEINDNAYILDDGEQDTTATSTNKDIPED